MHTDNPAAVPRTLTPPDIPFCIFLNEHISKGCPWDNTPISEAALSPTVSAIEAKYANRKTSFLVIPYRQIVKTAAKQFAINCIPLRLPNSLLINLVIRLILQPYIFSMKIIIEKIIINDMKARNPPK